MLSTLDIVKTIEDDEDVPDFSENSDVEEEVRIRFPWYYTIFTHTCIVPCLFHHLFEVLKITCTRSMCFRRFLYSWMPFDQNEKSWPCAVQTYGGVEV
jgi:hypothetical protein